ncbi:hypothetical protein LTS08_002728 [Lithohypha guttulata]|uniref:uncharacterized protein n=1 Tax=Lithohypha guttulata TaxID=1690604 RepID=UPI002DDFBE38|nr:hypothetical protein LTR51_000616 [Lithohypha guttulata]KAK5103315.1 hypothetical protein LTS08_002728 [Lithohypha guttulata]
MAATGYGGAAAAYGYPTFGTTATNGRIVSAYQQQFAANKEAAAVMRSQFYPQQNCVYAYHRRNEESICGVT